MKSTNTTLRSSVLRSTRMLTILVVALGLMVCQAQLCEAVEMGTAFTYQGRLIDANDAADGLYDFQFKLYDDSNDPCSGNQVGSFNKPDVDVIDGYFTVELDFGSSAFDGDARWLDIGVRPGVLNDPNPYTPLTPRIEITPMPYALHTRGVFVGNRNTFLGYYAGNSNTTGHDNTFLGAYAGRSNTTGWNNTFLGDEAGYSNTTGIKNTFLGLDAGRSNTTGGGNTFLGNHAGESNTEGNSNTFLGREAGAGNTTGTGNVFIGYQAGGNKTGSDKLYIANSFFDPPLIYGDFSTGKVGIATTSPGGYTLAVNGSAAKPGGGSWSNFSDIRLKELNGRYERGLSEVSKLSPVRYRYKENNDLELPSENEFVGVVSQQVQSIIPEAVEENDNGYFMVNNDPIIWAMVNAIKELKAENESLKQKLEALEGAIQQHPSFSQVVTKEVQE